MQVIEGHQHECPGNTADMLNRMGLVSCLTSHIQNGGIYHPHALKKCFSSIVQSKFCVLTRFSFSGQCEGHHIFPEIPSPLATSKLLEVSGLCFTVLVIALPDWKIPFPLSGLLLILFAGVMTVHPSLSTSKDTPHCCHSQPLAFLSFVLNQIRYLSLKHILYTQIRSHILLLCAFCLGFLSTDVTHYILFLLPSCSWVTCLICSNCLLLCTLYQYLLYSRYFKFFCAEVLC